MAADGSIVISAEIDDKQAQKELNSLSKKIDTLQNKLNQKSTKQSALAEEARQIGIEYDNARKKLEQMQSGDTFYTSSHIKEQEAAVKSLETQWDKARMAADKLRTEIYDGTQNLNQMKERAGEIQKRLSAASGSSALMARVMDRAQKSAAKFSLRIREVVRSALVFTLISQALASLREWLGKVVTANDQSAAAIARLKGALLTLAQPLVSVIIPAFTEFVNLLAAIISRVAEFVSALFGTTAEASAEAAEGLYNETEAIDGTGAAAKKASKSLANFDEINKLSSTDSAGAAGGSGAAGGIEPNFDTSFISSTMDEIINILGGALLAVGAVLAFSGVNIPLGLGLMAVGALILGSAIAENWDAIVTMLQGPLGIIMGILGGALIVMGAVLLFSGANIPLGLGMLAVGAVGLTSSIAANWDAVVSLLQGPLGAIVGELSVALLALGAVVLFSGANVGLGLGLMLAGAIGLAASVAANWDTVQAALQGPLGAITALLSTAFLVLGAIFTFTGANLPLGIGLLIVGAAGLATSIAANWDTIQSLLQGPIGAITALVSSALLVLGAILTFSGVATPLGLGLLVVGAVGLATTIAANWSMLTGILGGEISTITAIVSAALLVLGIILIFTGAAAPLGLGMLIAGGVGLATEVAPNWDFILDAIKGAWANIISWWDTNAAKYFTTDYWFDVGSSILSGLLDGLKSIWTSVSNWVSEKVSWITSAFSGAKSSASADYGTPSSGPRTASLNAATKIMSAGIPKLASGAVIPPNREFLAVLGDQQSETNVEAPLSTIEQALENVLNRTGFNQNSQVEAVIEVDGRQFGRLVYKYGNDSGRIIGGSLVVT